MKRCSADFIKERHMYPEASFCLIIYQGSGS